MIKLCQSCGEKPSSTVVQMNVDGVVRDICLCRECATKFGILRPQEHGYEKTFFGERNEKVCENCGTTESEFAAGNVGCAKCVYVFGNAKNIVEKKCGSSKHIGKTSRSAVLSKTKMETLLMRLEDATKRSDANEILRLKNEIRILGEENAKKQ